MKIDIGKVRERIRKLQEVERIASDPEMLALLETVIVNGNGPKNHVEPKQPGTMGAKDETESKKRGAVLDAVREAAMCHSGPFDGYQLAQEMEASGFVFSSKSPAITVNDALRSLVKKGEFEIHESGKTGQPTRFIKTGTLALE